MAQGRPPRRSKRKSEPVTIDLEAEKSSEGADAEARPVEAVDDGVTGEGAVPVAGAAPMDETKAGEISPDADAAHESATPDGVEGRASPVVAEASAPAEEPSEPEPSAPPPSAGPFVGETGAHGAGEAPVAPDARPSAAGGGRGLLAGLVGGAIVAALVLGLQAAGILPVPGSAGVANTSSRVADLGAEVDALKTTVADLKSNPPKASPDTSKAVTALQSEVKSLSGRLDELQGSARSSGASSADMAALKNNVGELGARLDSLSKTVAGLKSGVARADRATALASVVAATALKSAIDRGGPFAAELKAYQHVASADQVSQKLQDIADEGVPSHAALVQQFPDVANSILSATQGNGAQTGLFDRLMNSARSVIKVRPTGNVSGNAPSAIVARMETKLKAGNLKGVVDEWSSLPDPGRKASQSFIDKVKKRMTALQAADSALQDAMASTDKQG